MEARFTEHGCEFRLLLSYFSVHIRPILREALKLGWLNSQFVAQREDAKECW